jgi:hypothetical protein
MGITPSTVNPHLPARYPDTYSIAEIVFVDGTKTEFMVKAGKGIAKYLRDELRDHQCLTLRNDSDVLVVTREQLRCFTLRQITQENN